MAGDRKPVPPSLCARALVAFGVEFAASGHVPESIKGPGRILESMIVSGEGRTHEAVVLSADRFSGRVVRCESWGTNAIARPNLAGAAISGKMTPGQLAAMDAGYTPFYNNVYDVLSIAANDLASRLAL